MDRFFGLMPKKEVDLQKTYEDPNDLKVSIQAGKNGWSILYADGSYEYEDVNDTSENNFIKAYKIAQKTVGKLKECEAKFIPLHLPK